MIANWNCYWMSRLERRGVYQRTTRSASSIPVATRSRSRPARTGNYHTFAPTSTGARSHTSCHSSASACSHRGRGAARALDHAGPTWTARRHAANNCRRRRSPSDTGAYTRPPTRSDTTSWGGPIRSACSAWATRSARSAGAPWTRTPRSWPCRAAWTSTARASCSMHTCSRRAAVSTIWLGSFGFARAARRVSPRWPCTSRGPARGSKSAPWRLSTGLCSPAAAADSDYLCDSNDCKCSIVARRRRSEPRSPRSCWRIRARGRRPGERTPCVQDGQVFRQRKACVLPRPLKLFL